VRYSTIGPLSESGDRTMMRVARQAVSPDVARHRKTKANPA
jgi:hypothetical protein